MYNTINTTTRAVNTKNSFIGFCIGMGFSCNGYSFDIYVRDAQPPGDSTGYRRCIMGSGVNMFLEPPLPNPWMGASSVAGAVLWEVGSICSLNPY